MFFRQSINTVAAIITNNFAKEREVKRKPTSYRVKVVATTNRQHNRTPKQIN